MYTDKELADIYRNSKYARNGDLKGGLDFLEGFAPDKDQVQLLTIIQTATKGVFNYGTN